MAASGYRTLRVGVDASAEVEDRRSRFIALIRHVEDEAEADAFVAEVRARHHDARHNVPAWILADGRERCSDDGEPQRTAGMPMLEALRGVGLADVCCVVTRYFGGTLLGPGGLVRAYTGATQAAVATAEADDQVVEMTLVTRVVVQIPYSAYDRVRRMVTEAGGCAADAVFAEDVQLVCTFRSGEEAAFVSAMTEYANGEELCHVGEPRFAEFQLARSPRDPRYRSTERPHHDDGGKRP